MHILISIFVSHCIDNKKYNVFITKVDNYTTQSKKMELTRIVLSSGIIKFNDESRAREQPI